VEAKPVAAAELVPADEVKFSLSSVVAADVHLLEEGVLLGQSMLTGESCRLRPVPVFVILASPSDRSQTTKSLEF
jgi:magnesium-transporting ATPase (P-type)